MNIDVQQITAGMLGAAKSVVSDKWPITQKYFESETQIFAQRLAGIAVMYAAGDISESRAKMHLQFQKEAWETVLLTVAGLNQLMIEQALNAALDVIRDTVNTAIGFALI